MMEKLICLPWREKKEKEVVEEEEEEEEEGMLPVG